MTDHAFDPPTGLCTRCGVMAGQQFGGTFKCLAASNTIGIAHRLAKRRMGAESAGHGLDYPPVEKFPQPPKEPA